MSGTARFAAAFAIAMAVATKPLSASVVAGGPDEIARLKALEAETVRTIEAASKAFVFIEGGSGFLISGDGEILTNHHVVAGRSDVVVTLAGGRLYRARLLGSDPEGDVALLRIQPDGPVPFLELGDSEALKVGQPVIALGDPFLIASVNLFLGRAPPDLEPSASLGIVSAVHRYSEVYTSAIQVDVAVNRGNSGGPLLTLDGKAVGINGKIETRFAFGINSGVGYAVPSNQIKNFLDALRKANGGTVQHGSIPGLRVEDRSQGRDGIRIRSVESGSSAEKAGFQAGDAIIEIEGESVATRSRYQGIINTYPVGKELAFRIARGGETLTIKAALERGPAAYLGVRMEDHAQGGVVVREVLENGPAANAGVKAGDVILIFDRNKVESATQLRTLILARSAGDDVSLGILREGKMVELRVRLSKGEYRLSVTP